MSISVQIRFNALLEIPQLRRNLRAWPGPDVFVELGVRELPWWGVLSLGFVLG